MGWLGKFGHFITNSGAGGVRTLGHLGGEALKKVGILKHSYDNINNSFGGMLSKTIEGLIGKEKDRISDYYDSQIRSIKQSKLGSFAPNSVSFKD